MDYKEYLKEALAKPTVGFKGKLRWTKNDRSINPKLKSANLKGLVWRTVEGKAEIIGPIEVSNPPEAIKPIISKWELEKENVEWILLIKTDPKYGGLDWSISYHTSKQDAMNWIQKLMKDGGANFSRPEF